MQSPKTGKYPSTLQSGFTVEVGGRSVVGTSVVVGAAVVGTSVVLGVTVELVGIVVGAEVVANNGSLLKI